MAKKTKAKRMSRPMPVQNIVNTGPVAQIGAGSTNDYYLNAAHVLSMMNRKAFHQVTKAGHLKNYGVEFQVFNMTNASTAIRTASLAYPTYNAVRAWHFVRKERFADAGFKLSDLGYGSRLRIALDSTMADKNQSTDSGMLKPSNLQSNVADKGEWEFSDVIITPPVDPDGHHATALQVQTVRDSFTLHLCGDHVEDADAASMRFAKVGIIQSWTENRKGIPIPDAEQRTEQENPLAFARMSELVSEVITREVADEQGQKPPYANDDTDSGVSPFADLVIQGQLESKFPNPTTNNDMIICPGGLAKISITNNHSAAEFPQIYMRIIELD